MGPVDIKRACARVRVSIVAGARPIPCLAQPARQQFAMPRQQWIGGRAHQVRIDALHVTQNIQVQRADFCGIDLPGFDFLQMRFRFLHFQLPETRFFTC
jgi:hypothetical protein